MKTPKKEDSGCLWIFALLFLTLFTFIGLHQLIGLSTPISISIGVIIAAIITYRWLGIPNFISFLKNIGVIILIIAGLRFAGNLVISFTKTTPHAEHFMKEEGVLKSQLVIENDTIPTYTSHRVWKDNYGHNYRGDLTIREQDFLDLHHHLAQYKTNSNKNFWGGLYEYLESTDGPKLDLVMQTFERLHAEKKLNQMEFAEMVVSCIQDIPYSFVFQNDCLPAENYEHAIRRVLEDCPSCCLGNVPFGIQNSLSFLQNLKGDCDTRTVLIYSILKHFNYDVAILNSTFYRHSIIGLNIPASGLVKLHKGKKYVVWETTAKYYEAGALPGNFNDITHWEVVLTSK